MLRMTTTDIAAATGAAVLHDSGAVTSGDVVIDSRQAGPGTTFVAFAGEKVDGNRFAASAVAQGAACVALSADPAEGLLDAARQAGCSVLRAEGDDCEEFLLRLAAEWVRRHPEWLVVGVTGSVGKTTTKDMLRAGMGSQLRCHATAGNFNNLIGMPITVLSAPEDTQVLVLELGMNHTGEIERLVAACHPALACITNVGTSHIGLLGSRENIARAKAEVVGGMRAHDGVGPTLAMVGSGDYTAFIEEGFARPAGVSVAHVGMRETDDLRASDLRLGEDGCATFVASARDGWSREVTLRVPGRQVVPDYLLALQLCRLAGVDPDVASSAIEDMPATRMRLSVLEAPGRPRVIDDSYNASPNSMAAALDVLCGMACQGRRIAVLGEIAELGDEEARLHALVGAYAAAKPIDMLVLVGTGAARHTAEAARVMGFSDDALQEFDDVDAALATLRPVLSPTDLVLVKASRSAGLDAFARGVLE